MIGSVVLAIATDLFPPQMRGRVMGFIQTAFAASQVLGIPVGLYLSNHWNWHVPFLAMVVLGADRRIAHRLAHEAGRRDHLKLPQEHNAVRAPDPHRDRPPLSAVFVSTLVAGDRRLHADAVQQRLHRQQSRHRARRTCRSIYLVTGLRTIFVGPLVGKARDAFGKLRVFFVGSAVTIIMVLIYTHLGDVDARRP